MAGKISASVLQLFKNALNLNDDEEEPLIDLQVGKKVFHGVEKKMRSELWLSILHRKGIGIAAAKKYNFYLNQDIEMQTADDISKDVHRTFPKVQRFASEEGRRSLENVLRAYAAYDEEVGYCQGMNFLGGILLAWLPNEADAFGGLVVLMMDRGLREMYKHDMSMLQARLWQVGRLLPSRLASHLEMHGVLPVLYASSWLLTGFASDFPLFFSSRVMDVILTDRYVEAMMKLVVGIVSECGEDLLALDDMEEIVEVLKVTVPRWPRERLQALLTRSFAASWTPRQLRVLEQTEGAESVVDAVARVARASQDDGDGALPDQATSSAPGEPERGPSFRWAGNIRASNRQLPLLPPVLLPPRASSGNPAIASSGNPAGATGTPPTPATAAASRGFDASSPVVTPSRGFDASSPVVTPSPPVGDLLDVRLSWPGDASACGDTPDRPTWDPFGPCDSQKVPSQAGNGLGDWGAFTEAASVPATNPHGGSEALGAARPIGRSGTLGATHPSEGSGALSSPAHLSSSSDWHSALDAPLDSPFSARGSGAGGGNAHAGGTDLSPALNQRELTTGSGSEVSPRELTTGAASELSPRELTTGAGSESSPRESSTGAGSGRRASGLPPLHQSSFGKGGSTGWGLTPRLTGGLPNNGMMERRSESWGSFTEAGRMSELGGRASDLESWGSFRQPSDDGAYPEEGSRSGHGPEGGSDGDGLEGDGRSGREGGELVGGGWSALEGDELVGSGRSGLREDDLMGSGRSGAGGFQLVGRDGRDGSDGGVMRAMSLELPDSHGGRSELTPGRSEMTASISTPALITEVGAVKVAPRKDSALELDLLSRFMKEAVDVPMNNFS